jgi:surface-anchored protein
MKMNLKKTACMLAALAVVGSATAQPFRLAGGHADINLEFDGTELEIGFHTEFTDGHTQITGGAPQQNEFEADELIVAVPVGTTTARPAGAEYDPIGVPAGQRINVLPQSGSESDAAGSVHLGWGTEELTAADWSGDLTWTLTGVSGPGTFSAYKSGLTPTFRMASSDGVSAADSFTIEAGHHEHFNLGFSAPGTYQIQVAVSGTHNTAGVVSTTNTLTFDVMARPFWLTGGHADVNLEFDGSELEIGFHTEFTDGHTQITGGAPQQNEFEADELIVAVPVGTTTARPAGAEYDPTGVNSGENLFVLPQTDAEADTAGAVHLGWATEELTAAEWTGDITWTLNSVSGPGHFSAYESGLTPTFHMSSADGISAADAFTVEAGHHEHFNLGFTQPGTYQIGVTASGTHNTLGAVTGSSTLTFVVLAPPAPAMIDGPAFSGALPYAVLGADGSLALGIPPNSVNGDGLTYQWQLDGVDIPGATAATLNAVNAMPGNYRVVVSGSTGPAVPGPNVPVLRVSTIFVAGTKVEGPTAGLNLMLESSDAIASPTVFAPVTGTQTTQDGNVLRILDVERDPTSIGERFFRIGLQMPQP